MLGKRQPSESEVLSSCACMMQDGWCHMFQLQKIFIPRLEGGTTPILRDPGLNSSVGSGQRDISDWHPNLIENYAVQSGIIVSGVHKYLLFTPDRPASSVSVSFLKLDQARKLRTYQFSVTCSHVLVEYLHKNFIILKKNHYFKDENENWASHSLGAKRDFCSLNYYAISMIQSLSFFFLTMQPLFTEWKRLIAVF